MEGSKWKDTDIFKVIKEKKATLLLMNLAISSFQNRLAKQFEIKPGQEMIQGIESAKETRSRASCLQTGIFKSPFLVFGIISDLWEKQNCLTE